MDLLALRRPQEGDEAVVSVLMSDVAAGDQSVWLDSFGFLASVCTELGVGELVHGDNFSLFEAMSAVEIMDPKMDAGMAVAGFKTVDEVIESGVAPIQLSVQQLVDVFDQILACEATWHNGHALAQTVFSCLYLLDLERTIPNALLHAFCKCTRATCCIVRTTIALADISEEDDSITTAYGLPLEGEEDSRCISLLNIVEEGVARQLRGSKGSFAARRKVFEDGEPLQDDPALEQGYCQAVLCRLRFRKALHHTLTYMGRAQGRGLDIARKHVASALSELRDIRLSSAFLSYVHASNIKEESRERGSTASGRSAIGFDETVNRRLLAPHPPRSIRILSWEDTLAYFEKLLQDLDRVCSLPMTLGLEELLQFVADFHKSQPDLLARAKLQLVLLQDGKLMGREPLGIALVKDFNVPLNLMSGDHHTQAFVTHATRLTQQLLRLMCTNTAWQQRKLGRVILDWGSLLHEAKVAQDCFPCCSNLESAQDKSWAGAALTMWVAEQTCWIVRQFLMLGFHLDLYSLNEYCMVYWYLDHVLSTSAHYMLAKETCTQSSLTLDAPDSGAFLTLHHIRLTQKASLALLNFPPSVKKKGKKKKGVASLKQLGGTPKDSRSTSSAVLLQCYSDLCKGFVWMLSALTHDHKLVQRSTIFNTEEERFLQRFDVLQKVMVPEPMSYVHFKESTRQGHLSVKELYQLSYDHFMAAQQHLQELALSAAKAPELSTVSRTQWALEVKQMEHVVLRNRIALQIAHQAGPGDNLRVSFDFAYHPCFAVAVVKKS